MQRDRPFIPRLPPAEKRERDEPNNTNKTSWADVASRREGIALDPPGDMEVGAAAADP